MKDSGGISAGTTKVPQRPKQERSLLTRQQLVNAARVIFARDGFERARLQDISSEAGKTRGAFYVHFKDKEDVFFAIFEEDLARDREHLLLLQQAQSQASRLEALAAHVVSVIEDRQRMLLGLEFKMYVLRHSQDQKRISDLHLAICERDVGNDLSRLFQTLPAKTSGAKGHRQLAQLGAMIDGLALNRFFNPASFRRKDILAQASLAVRSVFNGA